MDEIEYYSSNPNKEIIKLIGETRDSNTLLNLWNTQTRESISILCGICYKKKYINLVRAIRNYHLFNYNNINKYLIFHINYYTTDIINYILFIIEELEQCDVVPNIDINLALKLCKIYKYENEYQYILSKNKNIYNNLLNDFEDFNF